MTAKKKPAPARSKKAPATPTAALLGLISRLELLEQVVAQKPDGLGARLARLEEFLGNSQKLVDVAALASKEVARRLDGHDASIEALAKRDSMLQNRVDEHNDAIQRAASVHAVTHDLDKVSARIAALEDYKRSLPVDLGTIREQLDVLRRDGNSLRSKLVDIEAKTKELGDLVALQGRGR